MTPEEYCARAEAYDEAAEHVDRGLWTADDEERRQGQEVAKRLRKAATSLRGMAMSKRAALLAIEKYKKGRSA